MAIGSPSPARHPAILELRQNSGFDGVEVVISRPDGTTHNLRIAGTQLASAFNKERYINEAVDGHLRQWAVMNTPTGSKKFAQAYYDAQKLDERAAKKIDASTPDGWAEQWLKANGQE